MSQPQPPENRPRWGEEATTVLPPGEGLLVRVDAVGGDFDLGNAAEREQKLYKVLGRLFRSLFHDAANSVGDRGLEHDALGLQAGQVHTHELAWLEHESYAKILPLRVVECKPFRMIPGAGDRQSILKDGSGVARLFLRFVRTGLKTRQNEEAKSTGLKTRHYKGETTGRKTRHNGRGGA
jgi:hypothetical protein